MDIQNIFLTLQSNNNQKTKSMTNEWLNQTPEVLKEKVMEVYNNGGINTTITENGPTEGDLEVLSSDLSYEYGIDFDTILEEMLLAFDYQEYLQELKK